MARLFDPFERPELLKETSRARDIERLDRVYRGRQYDGRADWWTGRAQGGAGGERPLRERKPCVVYRLPRAATQQVVRFLFGEQRFPRIGFPPTDAESKGDTWYPSFNDEETETLDTWLADLISESELQSHMRAIAEKAISCRTAVAIVELKDGKFRITLASPQHCYATFKDDDPTQEVERLLWCYEYECEVADESGRPVCKTFIFRREYDAQATYVYEDAPVEPGKKIEWGAVTRQPHGLSFCPVRWFRNTGDYSTSLDGESLYDGLEEEFEALDMTLSRRHQGLIYLGAPQLVETGVDPDDGPDATGRKAGPEGFGSAQGAPHQVAPKARRIAPDAVWTYQGEKVDVKLLETSGKAFEVATNHVNDIRSRILETMGVVLTSMADTINRVTVGAEMSARFLALAHAPLIALVQEYRSPWWSEGLRPLLSMMMRMVVETSAGDGIVLVPNTEAALPLLQRFKTEDGWTTPRMVPTWGKFFDPSATELKQSVETAVSARDGRLIASTTAVESIAHDFDIESPQQELEAIEEDKAEAVAEAQQQMAAQQPEQDPQDGNLRPKDGGANRRSRKARGKARKEGGAGNQEAEPRPER